MDERKSIKKSTLYLIILSASGVLIFGLISGLVVVRLYGPEALYFSRTGRSIIAMVLVFAGVICYYSYLRITGRGDREAAVPAKDPVKDTREGTLDVDLPYHQAFDLCRRALYFLPGGEIRFADEEKGIIKGWARTPDPSWVATPIVTITLQKVSAGRTHVHIHCITPLPTPNPVSQLINRYFSENERYVKRLQDFLGKYSRSIETAPMGNSGPAAGYGKGLLLKNPVLSGILSLVIPGLGQAYNGQQEKGLLIAFGAGFGLLFALVPGILVWAYGMYDAYLTAVRINTGAVPFRPASALWIVLTICVALAFLAVAYLFIWFFGPLGALGYNPDIVLEKV